MCFKEVCTSTPAVCFVLVLVSYAVFSHVLHRKSLPLLPLPMFCSLILIKIPTAEFAYGLPRVPCQSLVDSFCPCATGLGMPESSPGAFCRAPHVLSQQPDGFYPSLSKQLTLKLCKNYCFGSALMCLSQGSSANVCFGLFLGSLGLRCCCSLGLQSRGACALRG